MTSARVSLFSQIEGGNTVEITIKGDANEIAALVLNLQVRQSGVIKVRSDETATVEAAIGAIRDMREGTKN